MFLSNQSLQPIYENKKNKNEFLYSKENSYTPYGFTTHLEKQKTTIQ